MPSRVGITKWIITDVRIPVPALRTCLVRDDAVRLGEVVNIRRIPLSRTFTKKAGQHEAPYLSRAPPDRH
jgi:hypothetical protein